MIALLFWRHSLFLSGVLSAVLPPYASLSFSFTKVVATDDEFRLDILRL